MKAQPGEMVVIRTFGKRLVVARVKRRALFMRLVTWRVNGSLDGEKIAWRPVWRMW